MAYGAKGERNGLHATGKHQHAWWCWDSDWIALQRIAMYHKLDSVTGLLHAIARGSLAVNSASALDQRRLSELVKDSYDLHKGVKPLTDDDIKRVDSVK